MKIFIKLLQNNPLIFILLFLVGIRFSTAKDKTPDGVKVRITTTVLTDPIKYDNSQYINAAGLKIYLPLFPEIYYGDKIILEGDTQNGFLKNAKLVGNHSQDKLLFDIRKRLLSFYQSNLPEPFSGLLSGVVIGDKGALTAGFWKDVKKVGVAHVVVASGTNITFVTSFLIAFLSIFTKRKILIPFVILGILLYMFISGFQAPIVRAALMSSALLLTQALGRPSSGGKVLVSTALVMLAINPAWLGDIGFILSFVSTASLMLFQKRIDSYFRFMPGLIREGFSTSLAAQIGVAPILFVTFGEFYILSPVVNALVLWTIPFIMIFGSIAGVVSLIFEPLAKLVLIAAYPFLFWFVKIVELFA